jgi:hypothetical protein
MVKAVIKRSPSILGLTAFLHLGLAVWGNDPARAEPVKFACERHEGRLTTTAQTQRGKVELIRWVETFGVGQPELHRCQGVAERLQNLYDQNLRFLTTGRYNRTSIICAARQLNEACDTNGLVLVLRPNLNPQQALIRLFSISYKRKGIINESSRLYIDLEELLKTAPLVNNTTQLQRFQRTVNTR